MLNADGSPQTAHTTNLVHLIFAADDAEQYHLADGKLADIAPTMLGLLGLDAPEEMTGTPLLTLK
jgi:2,3-bisphosphoglycerate-independent phosphoglycerate mutase